MVDLLTGLNKEQAEAVSAGNGATLVVAGPGSGKTRVLTRRVAYLIQEMGVNPSKIMAVTFTNKAAREMQERIGALLGEGARGVAVGTFHSICARLLRREIGALGYRADYTIYDSDDQLAVIKGAMSELNIDPKKFAPYGQLNKISAAKNELISPLDYQPTIPPEKITRDIYIMYQKILRVNNAVDFDDLLMLPVMLFREQPDILKRYQRYYDHILVDEFQDTNTAQYVLLKLLAGAHQNLFVVGDPDQSIYRFRGAVPKNVGTFARDFKDTRTVKLGENYRSHQLILDAATAVIEKNRDHIKINLTGQRKTGQKLILYNTMTEEGEAQYIVEQIALYSLKGIRPRDCAVMYRVNSQSRALETAFVSAGLPYRLIGGQRFYSRKEVKDLLAYLRVVYNPDDTVNLLRVINTPPRGIGEKTVTQLQAWADSRRQSLYSALLAIAQGEQHPFSARSEKPLNDFTGLLRTWEGMRDSAPVGQLVDDILTRTRLLQYLDDGNDESSQDRIDNVKEFRGLAVDAGAQTLGGFLEEVALVADADNKDDAADAPTLLTLHAAKGLEYPVVFIPGMEEGTLPHSRSLDDPEQMDEERRLMYVGITRAKDILHLSWVMRRSTYGGQGDYMSPSRFLSDIPKDLTEGSALPTGSRARAETEAYRQAVMWDRPTPTPGTPPNVKPILARPVPVVKYRPGAKVKHEKWGDGIVISSTVRGGVEELFVKFGSTVGARKLMADFVTPAEE